MYESILDPIQKLTSTVAETVASFVSSSDVPELRRVNLHPVTLPKDLYAHADVQTEWWYYTGHCQTESNKRFGFELAFFKRRTDLDKFGVVPLKLIANPMYAAHFAITEIDAENFRYDHIRSFGKPLDTPVRMSETSFDISLGDWSVRADGDKHILHATLPDGLVFDATLDATKPPTLHGLDNRGVSERHGGQTSQHFSFTRMQIDGTISKDGRAKKFDGVGWMDREFGTWEQTHWDWFSIQLDDETELMIYHLRDLKNGRREYSHGRFIKEDGSSIFLSNSEFELAATGEWTSTKTGTTYPSGWKISVPSLEIDLDISPLIGDQELDTRGTSMVIYWEGACSATGTRIGKQVTGNSYVELVGYHTMDRNDILSFFLGKYI